MRVLFVLADTNRSVAGTAVIELHRALANLGVQMRTVALGPGRGGGLDNVIPVLSPASRSLSAVTQLRREQRWSDVVVCWGLTPLLVQKLGGSRRRTPTVMGPGSVGHAGGALAAFAGRGATSGPIGLDPTRWRDLLCEVVDIGVR